MKIIIKQFSNHKLFHNFDATIYYIYRDKRDIDVSFSRAMKFENKAITLLNFKNIYNLLFSVFTFSQHMSEIESKIIIKKEQRKKKRWINNKIKASVI